MSMDPQYVRYLYGTAVDRAAADGLLDTEEQQRLQESFVAVCEELDRFRSEDRPDRSPNGAGPLPWLAVADLLLSEGQRGRGYAAGAKLVADAERKGQKAQQRRESAERERERLRAAGGAAALISAAEARLKEAEAALELQGARKAAGYALTSAYQDRKLTADERSRLEKLRHRVEQARRIHAQARAALPAPAPPG